MNTTVDAAIAQVEQNIRQAQARGTRNQNAEGWIAVNYDLLVALRSHRETGADIAETMNAYQAQDKAIIDAEPNKRRHGQYIKRMQHRSNIMYGFGIEEAARA